MVFSVICVIASFIVFLRCMPSFIDSYQLYHKCRLFIGVQATYGHYFFDLHSGCYGSPMFGCILVTLLQMSFQFVPKGKKKKKTRLVFKCVR